MKTQTIKVLLLCSLALLAASCASQKDIMYFQDIDTATLNKLSNEYEAIIKKDDMLSILVSGPDKSVIAPYNLTLSENLASGGDVERSTLAYLVDCDGNINFPIIGRIHVEGMTRNQLANYLTRRIGEDVTNPIVRVAFANYKITVLGEVRNPGTYTMESEKISLLQALGRAGDLTLNAKRDDIILLREEDGVQRHYKIDLRNAHTLDSPQFYLQQNDVIYVPASATRVANATTASGILSTVFSSITTLIALVTFTANIAGK